MALLGAFAVRQRYSLAGFARKVECTPLALRHFFEARSPRLETVERVSTALGFTPVVARVLIGALDKRDAYVLRGKVAGAVRRRGVLFDDVFAAQDALIIALDAATIERRYRALEAFELARVGLIEPQGGAAALAPELFALADLLDVKLGTFIADSVRRKARDFERCAVRAWVFEAFAFSPHDGAVVESIFARYIGEGPKTSLHALAAAQAAYSASRPVEANRSVRYPRTASIGFSCECSGGPNDSV